MTTPELHIGIPSAYTPSVTLDAPFDVLRAITRRLATTDDLGSVLQSITQALVQRADAAVARVFLLMGDDECEYCRRRIEAGEQTRSTERALHLVLSAEVIDDAGAFHRIPVDSLFPVAVALRLGEPSLVDDWRELPPGMLDPRVTRIWRRHGIVGLAAYPLAVRGESLGAIGYVARRAITRTEYEVLGVFADQAAMAIKGAFLFRELERHRDRLQAENAYLQDELRADLVDVGGFDHIVGESPALRAVLRRVRQVASVETTVLITGETGTGKELVARAIHERSARASRPLIKINCGAIPQGVVESELFGHEKGAFTGALQRRVGRFELADKGSLFMDEVGELPLDTQVKLLRVLQEREFERVGSATPIAVDVRLVAATNRDLEREVAEGRFRADLYYRLNVFPIRIPPLRERPSDIPLLVRHFLAHFQRKLAKPLRAMDPASMEQLQRYPWPGNIRELQNVLERACVLATEPVVKLAEPLRMPASRVSKTGADTAPITTLDESERAHIRRALAAANGRVHGPAGAAVLLGVNPSTLRSRMQKLGIGRGSPS
ncbi:sigma-54 factor interaction domain-containing protein (plasmid) [Gemmatirosa kalamazoonensis]|uniref:Sigma-54 factor interaction domain-containing protein n=1 Tax=Gemmatirosa kalamazoonensis TaxID=861299 RepID=W0RQL4_9BACT|nr:sigma 54-interacting transcriptional regulator [Gemmatirosa kalamazoonensis]AHG93011.1 sigma-54 factor interaction domain-containing protein [Gemmatirosa kalamazoonensis]